jgi:hypothetical protein
MRYIQKSLTIAEFWEIKKEIDREVQRVGWGKEKCIAYISSRYHARSRLAMSDYHLIHFRDHLKTLPDKKALKPSSKKLLRNRLTIHL